jgi:hypothetical protein
LASLPEEPPYLCLRHEDVRSDHISGLLAGSGGSWPGHVHTDRVEALVGYLVSDGETLVLWGVGRVEVEVGPPLELVEDGAYAVRERPAVDLHAVIALGDDVDRYGEHVEEIIFREGQLHRSTLRTHVRCTGSY